MMWVALLIGMVIGGSITMLTRQATQATRQALKRPPAPLSRSQQRTRAAAEAYAEYHPGLVSVRFVRRSRLRSERVRHQDF